MFIALIFSASVLFGSAGATAFAPVTIPAVAATALATSMTAQGGVEAVKAVQASQG